MVAVTRAGMAAALDRALEQAQVVSHRKPLEHQRQPEGDWFGWMLLAGRGAGKTEACARYVVNHVQGARCLSGPEPHRIGIVGPTLGDAADACFYGPSGIRTFDLTATLVGGGVKGAEIRWQNGSVARLFGTRDPNTVDNLRAGGNRCLVWFEELAAMRYMQAAFDQAMLGLRVGPDPRWIASTTPRPKPLIRAFAKGFVYRGQWTSTFADRTVVMRHATTDDNPHLMAHIRATLYEAYASTSLGEQEIEGRVIDQNQNALWQRDQIARYRLTLEQCPTELLRRVVVGVDPSGGSGEQGIVVVGFTDQPFDHPEHREKAKRGVVLADYTCTLPPDGWGDRAVQAAMDWDADAICCESDYGRDMPLAVLVNAATRAGLQIPVRPALARALGNKRARAYPVAQLAAQGRYPHRGVHEGLEDQVCTWTEADDDSPDRMDAAVWPAWHVGLVTKTFTGAGAMPDPGLATRSLTASLYPAQRR